MHNDQEDTIYERTPQEVPYENLEDKDKIDFSTQLDKRTTKELQTIKREKNVRKS